MDTVHECDRRTDRQTDRRTDRITITKTVLRIASHGTNDWVLGFAGIRSYLGEEDGVILSMVYTN